MGADEVNLIGDQLQLEVSYYTGAYGTTVRIATHSKEALTAFRTILKRLADGIFYSHNLCDYPSIRMDGCQEFILECLPDSKSQISERTVFVSSRRDGGIRIKWICTLASWRQNVGLIDGILVHDAPCHQYFSIDGVDDALLIIAYKELL